MQKGAKDCALLKINELLTIIFDPHAYYNTFTIISGNSSILKHKLSKKIIPKYKSKTYATSNLIDQLFTKFASPSNIINHNEKGIDSALETDMNVGDWNREKRYVAESKALFFKFLFTKVNQQLKKRNLDPIFTIQKEDNKCKSIIKDKFELEKIEEELDSKFNTTSQLPKFSQLPNK